MKGIGVVVRVASYCRPVLKICHRQFGHLSSRSSFCPRTKQVRWISSSKAFPLFQDTGEYIEPYVDPVYSYAFGRSNGHLIYRTIGEMLDFTVSNCPNKVAIISTHQDIQKTYQEMNRDIDALCHSLVHRLGIQKGDVVGVWSTNIYEYIVTQFAINKIGAIYCAINPLFKKPEIEYALELADVKTLFMPGKDSPQNEFNNYQSIIQEIDLSKTSLKNIVYLEAREADPCRGLKTFGFWELVKETPDKKLSIDVHPDDVASIFFTSGTTGKPKGAANTHFKVINNCLFGTKRMGVPYDNDMIINLPLPLFHVFAGGGAVYSLPVCPTTVVLPSYRYSAKAVVTAFNKYKCKELLAVPTMAIDILNYCQKKEIKIPSFLQFVVGAAPVPEELAIDLKNYFPSITNITVGYGCTEAGPVCTVSHPSVDQSIKNSTCGTPLDFVHVKIVDIKTNQTVKHGEVGEVLVTGNVMKEYWKSPEKTKEVVENGWYRTGDLGTLDSKGFLRIVGRTKELIIRGGANIYPREVEEVIMLHDNVLMAAVCGLPHSRLGEEVCAWVQLKDPKAGTSVKDIQDFCKDRIANYKIPVQVLFVNSFPMTASGKIQKFAMTEQSPELIRQQGK